MCIGILHIKGLQHDSPFQPSSDIVHAPLTYLLYSLHWPCLHMGIYCDRFPPGIAGCSSAYLMQQ
jgi:hypothetical protein